jgi:hypothetical protein
MNAIDAFMEQIAEQRFQPTSVMVNSANVKRTRVPRKLKKIQKQLGLYQGRKYIFI